MLRQGGNALDAAVATAYALGVVEPFSAGLGGGGFLLYFDAKTKKTTVFDYREVAPKRATRDMYLSGGKVDPIASTDGIKSVAVPGMVPGLDAAERKLGKKRLKDVLGPAIKLAEEGFLVYPNFARASFDRVDVLAANEATAKVFLKNGAPYRIGERLVQKDLARTLRDLSRQGPRLFTHGRVAQAIAKESERLGGLLRLEDLQAFKLRLREPLVGEYRGYTIVTMPPPSSGGVVLLQMLKMRALDREQNHRAGSDREGTAQVHTLIEIMRRAYADRAAFMGDPAFVKVPVDGLLADDYVAARFQTIDPLRATPSSAVKEGAPRGAEASNAAPLKEPAHTTHLVAIDKDGNVATLTQTVNYAFGSGVVVPGTGVLLNDEMDDFAAALGVPNVYGLIATSASNTIQPGKIPLSSMTPTLVLKDGKVRLALGAPGGATIITTVLQIILHLIDHSMDVAHAVAAPRIHMQWQPDEVRIERGAINGEVESALKAMGHKIVLKDPWGNANAVEIDADGVRTAASDSRHDGAPDAE